ncbi:MAG: hypothetical protein ACJ8GN_17945 [Longimicrobiaceae bacterium]
MSLYILPSAMRATDSNNVPLSGAKLYFYQSGTLTSATVYSDPARTTAHASPVVADAAGLFAPIYLNPSVTYRAILKNAAGVTIDDIDPYLLSDVAAVGTRTAMAAIPAPTNFQAVFLAESGREGMFVFSTANLSAAVTADPDQGVYVPPASTPSGASGAWVRKTGGYLLTPQMLGAPFSSSTPYNAVFTSGRGFLYLPPGSRTAAANAFITQPLTIFGPGEMTAPTQNAPAVWVGNYQNPGVAERFKLIGVHFEGMREGTTDDSAMIRCVQSRGAMIAFNTVVDSWNAIGLIYQPNLVTGDVAGGQIVPASPEGKANDSLVFGNYIHNSRMIAIEVGRVERTIVMGNIIENDGAVAINPEYPEIDPATGQPHPLHTSSHGIRWVGYDFTDPKWGQENRGNLAVGNIICDRGGHGHSIQHWFHHGVASSMYLENCVGGIRANRTGFNGVLQPPWAGYHALSNYVIKDCGSYGVYLSYMTSCALSNILVDGATAYGFVDTGPAGTRAKNRIDGASHRSANSGGLFATDCNFITLLVADNEGNTDAFDLRGDYNLVIVLVTTAAARHVTIYGDYNHVIIVTQADVQTNLALTVYGTHNGVDGIASGKVTIIGDYNRINLITTNVGSNVLDVRSNYCRVEGLYEGTAYVRGDNCDVDATFVGTLSIGLTTDPANGTRARGRVTGALTIIGDNNDVDMVIGGNVSIPAGSDGNTLAGRVNGTLNVAGNNNFVPARVTGAITNTGATNTKPAAAVAL